MYTETYQLPVNDRYTRRCKSSFILKILHLYNIDEYSNTNRIVVMNIRPLIFGIRFSSNKYIYYIIVDEEINQNN
jgi:hypothetical protein